MYDHLIKKFNLFTAIGSIVGTCEACYNDLYLNDWAKKSQHKDKQTPLLKRNYPLSQGGGHSFDNWSREEVARGSIHPQREVQ